MSNDRNYIFKLASEPSEFRQIFQLNYDSFVEEIPQHAPNAEHTLQDKFHDKNSYIICLTKDGILAGMLSIADERPYSLDAKIDNLDEYLIPDEKSCEIRLLAVKPDYRSSFVFFGLANALADYCQEKGYTIAFISGTTRQLKLYKHLGFVPFGDLVGQEGVQFQPMYKTADGLERVPSVPAAQARICETKEAAYIEQ
jgi:GNAT superfamily N-acetyltransferase